MNKLMTAAIANPNVMEWNGMASHDAQAIKISSKMLPFRKWKHQTMIRIMIGLIQRDKVAAILTE